MPYETVTITTSGANPGTKTVTVFVDPNTGAGSTQVQFGGANGGQDQYVATANIAGQNYTSNTAFVGWQAASAPVNMLIGMEIEGHSAGGSSSWNGVGTLYGWHAAAYGGYKGDGSGGLGTSGNTSVVINQPANNWPIAGIVTNDGYTGEYRHIPVMYDDVKTDGTAVTTLGTPLGWGVGGVGGGGAVTFFNGFILVTAGGVETFYFEVDDSWGFYVGGGASSAGGTSVVNGGPLNAAAAASGTYLTNVGAWPLMATRNNAANPVQPTDYAYVNFPAAGIYPFLVWWVSSPPANNTYFEMTYAQGQGAIPPNGYSQMGSVLKPVNQQPAPPATNPSGNVALNAPSPSLLIAGTGATTTITVAVSGIHYATKQYIPLLETVAGTLKVANNGPTTFTLQTYNGQAVDRNAAAANIFKLGGDNSAWQGRLTTSWDGSSPYFNLVWNGGGVASGVATTQLTLTADDLAWWNASQGCDLFSPSGGNGGISWGMEVDWMILPAVDGPCSISPTSGVPADGGSHTISVRLPKPFSAQQQGTGFANGNSISTTASASAGAVAGTCNPVYNGSWLIGWDIPVTVPASSVNGSFVLAVNCAGNLTFLRGTSIWQQGVQYLDPNAAPGTQAVATISTVGSGYVAPVPSNWHTTPAGVTDTSGTVTYWGQVYTYDPTPNGNGSQVVMAFQWKPASGGAVTTFGGGGEQAVTTGTVGGKTVYYHTYGLAATDLGIDVGSILIGFTATDLVSGLSVQWFDSSPYTTPSSGGGGGGGGGGCPAVEMWVDEWHQVSDIFVGMGLDALAEDPSGAWADSPIATQAARVSAYSFSEQPCYRLVTANGCELVVSASTPVPTLEGCRALAAGERRAVYVSDLEAGMHVATMVENLSWSEMYVGADPQPSWSELVEVTPVGMRRVCKLSCGGRNFAAGARPGRYIYTHNMGSVKTG